MRRVEIVQDPSRPGWIVRYYVQGQLFETRMYAHMCDVLAGVEGWLTY